MDQRSAARHRILRAATIEFGGNTIPCMVRNMSDVGAMLDVTTTAEIPELFTLTARADGHRTLCRLVWRNEKRIGVAFE
jgi:PilZ domain